MKKSLGKTSIILVLIVISMCFTGCVKKGGPYDIGTEFVYEDIVSITIEDASVSEAFFDEKNMESITLLVSIENLSSEDNFTYDENHFYICDSKNDEVKYSISDNYIVRVPLGREVLEPGGKGEGTMIFDVEKGCGDYLEYTLRNDIQPIKIKFR